METRRAFLSGCMAFLSFSSPKGSAEALPEVFSPLQNLPALSHTANTCRIRRLPTLPELLCEIAVKSGETLDKNILLAEIDRLSTVDNQLEAFEVLKGTIDVLMLRGLKAAPNQAYGISLFL